MLISRYVAYEPLRSLAASSVLTSYVAIGGAFAYPSRMIWVTNNTNGNIIFSVDGINDHFFLAANTGDILDLATNQTQPNDGGWFQAKGTIIYAKWETSAPGSPSGKVYVSTLYGKPNLAEPGATTP